RYSFYAGFRRSVMKRLSCLSIRRRVILTTAFLSIAVATFAAHANPMDEFELSIYLATPMLFWVGLFILIAISVWLIIIKRENINLGIMLLLLSSILFYFLQIIRGYWYTNRGDSLTHLGIARDWAAGGPVG